MSMDCFCDYDPADFYSARMVKARKPRKCAECCRVIYPGEDYELVAGKWDGCITRFLTCSHCLDIRQFVKNSVPCFCWGHGSMLNDADETIQDAYDRARDEVKGLFVGYARLIIKRKRAARAVITQETE